MGKMSQPKVEDRNYSKEVKQTLQTQGQIFPQYLQLANQFAPQVTDLQGRLAGQAAQTSVGQMANVQQGLNQNWLSSIQQNPILANLYNTTLQQSQLGGALSPDQQREATQAAYTGLASAGRATSNAGILQSILNRSNYSNQLLQQHMQNTLSGLGGLSENNYGYNLGQGMFTSSPQNVGGIGSFSVNPESSYAQDIFNTNLNKNANMATANQNSKAGLFGGLIGGAAKIGAAFIP